jgi:carboxylesterase type B
MPLQRWRKTVPKTKLSAPLDTKKYARDCAQIGPGWPSLGGMIKDCHNFMQGCPNMTWSNATSEDCLYLNVYAPESSTDSSPKLPVIVYFPSGAFQWGASNDWENNAYKKAENLGWKDVLLVTSAYRTGIFGFLASPGLSARSGDNSSGLFGIHDQTMVLKWIQRNIGAFGGVRRTPFWSHFIALLKTINLPRQARDKHKEKLRNRRRFVQDKDRVMIYGESAGATSMSLHLVMPESAGLFHAVAIDSGCVLTTPSAVSFLYMKAHDLPRQARDKLRGKPQQMTRWRLCAGRLISGPTARGATRRTTTATSAPRWAATRRPTTPVRKTASFFEFSRACLGKMIV